MAWWLGGRTVGPAAREIHQLPSHYKRGPFLGFAGAGLAVMWPADRYYRLMGQRWEEV